MQYLLTIFSPFFHICNFTVLGLPCADFFLPSFFKFLLFLAQRMCPIQSHCMHLILLIRQFISFAYLLILSFEFFSTRPFPPDCIPIYKISPHLLSSLSVGNCSRCHCSDHEHLRIFVELPFQQFSSFTDNNFQVCSSLYFSIVFHVFIDGHITVAMAFLGCHALNFFFTDGDSNITDILADFIIIILWMCLIFHCFLCSSLRSLFQAVNVIKRANHVALLKILTADGAPFKESKYHISRFIWWLFTSD